MQTRSAPRAAHTTELRKFRTIRCGVKRSLSALRILALVLFALFLPAASFFLYLFITLPDPTLYIMTAAPKSTHILDRHGTLLYEVHGDVKRTPVPLEDIPSYVKNATIAIEDKEFYSHPGFKITSIIRAMLVNFRHGEIRQGASTITQQMARMALLDQSPTYTRKIKELVLAVKIELRYTKDEILEMYLNNAPYGGNAYGIEAASDSYFKKHVHDLTLLESAYLAALPKAPSDYSPYGPNAETLKKRAHEVLRTMEAEKYIYSIEKEAALRDEPLVFLQPKAEIHAPHFVFYVIDTLIKRYGEHTVRNGGLFVRTTLDLPLQEKAESIIAERGLENEKKYGAGNASLVALDSKNGEILAMVGSRDYFREEDGAVNVALQPRQPGSSFKPYVYATAFMHGQSPASMILDVETNFASDNHGIPYIPHNYTGRNYGPVSIRQALAGSLNVPAVKVLLLSGINNAIDTAEQLGITTLKERKRFGPALVLGGAEVTLLEHTAGIGTFGTGGKRQPTTPILSITKDSGEIVYEKQESPGLQAIDPQVAYLITDILSDTNARQFIFGLGKNLRLPDRPVAVKTGTTQQFRDAWTVGYTPSLAVGVWVGNNDNSPMKEGADGSVVAAPIWNSFMVAALENTPPEPFVRPAGIVELTVDAVSGKLPTKYTPFTKKEIFASFNAPKDSDDVHVPSNLADSRVVIMRLRSEKPDDPLWEGAVRRWIESF